METSIAVFRSKEIRKTIHNDEWWFSVVDVCAILTESADPGAYWRKLKQRLKNEESYPPACSCSHLRGHRLLW